MCERERACPLGHHRMLLCLAGRRDPVALAHIPISNKVRGKSLITLLETLALPGRALTFSVLEDTFTPISSCGPISFASNSCALRRRQRQGHESEQLSTVENSGLRGNRRAKKRTGNQQTPFRVSRVKRVDYILARRSFIPKETRATELQFPPKRGPSCGGA